jgi:hypothetical protein
MGIGWRFEQLLRGDRTFTLDGKTQHFRAVGLRIKRQSVRPMSGPYRQSENDQLNKSFLFLFSKKNCFPNCLSKPTADSELKAIPEKPWYRHPASP